MKANRKPLGVGSLSLFIFVFSTFVSFWSFNRKLLGEHIMDYVPLNLHYIFITVVLLAASIVLGWKFSDNLFSKSGLISSSVFLGLIVVLFAVDVFISMVDMVL